jgi:hypothetical protein
MTVNMVFRSDDAAAMYLIMHLASRLSNAGLRLFLSGHVLPHLREEIEESFATETDPEDESWLSLAEATITIRESKGYGSGPINQRTGELKNFIMRNSFLGEIGGAFVLQIPGQNASGELGHKMQVAAGADPKFSARPILGLTENDLAFVVGSMNTWIIGGAI